MDDVVNADMVSVVRPIDLPSGTYSPDAVVTIDSGNRNEPLKKLPLGELMPKTDGVSVLKGNCDDHQIKPESEGEAPEDWDCYEVEKEGEDIWIGSDKRVHAKAGWYHVDMGVYIETDPGDSTMVEDARAAILFGAYTGDAPDSSFDYSDYCAVDFDLSYDHSVTSSVGVDVHVENDGDVIHLSVAAPTEKTAECFLDWFSVHRIAEVISGGSGGDTPSSDCNVHVIDLQLLDDAGDDLWLECVSALLDGKLLTICIDNGGIGLVCNCEQALSVPSGYTKDSYIAYLRNTPVYSTLSFFGRQNIAGIMAEGAKFTVAPTYGLRVNWLFVSMSDIGVGVSVKGNSVTPEFASNDIFGFDYTDPDNPRTTLENLGYILVDVQNYGIPVLLSCRNSTRQFRISGPCYLKNTTPLVLICHSIADYYEDPDNDATSEQMPVDYQVALEWTPDPSWTNTQGYYTIDVDHVYPLALDSRFGGPVDGGFVQ